MAESEHESKHRSSSNSKSKDDGKDKLKIADKKTGGKVNKTPVVGDKSGKENKTPGVVKNGKENISPAERERSLTRSKDRKSSSTTTKRDEPSSSKKTEDSPPRKKLKKHPSLPITTLKEDDKSKFTGASSSSDSEEDADYSEQSLSSEESTSSSSSSSSDESVRSRKSKKKKVSEKKKKEQRKMKKLRKKFFHFKDKKTKYQFKLSKDLAKWANDQITTFTPDKTIDDEILLKNQVPTNISGVPTVDAFIEDLLKEKGRKDVTFDASLQRLHKKIRDVFGPLSKIWEVVHAVTENLVSQKELNFNSLAELLQQTVIVLSQAINAVTFHRRRTILRGLIGDDQKSTQWIKSTYQEQLKTSKEVLFGEEVRAQWTKDAKAKDLSLKNFLAPSTERKKPFRKASHSETPSRGEARKRTSTGENRYYNRPNVPERLEGRNNKTFVKRGKGKAHLQHVLKRCFKSCPKGKEKHTPTSIRTISRPRHGSQNSRKAKTLRRKLGEADKRSKNPRNSEKRLGNSAVRKTLSKRLSKVLIQQKSQGLDYSRSREHAGEGSNKESKLLPKSDSQQHLPEREEGGLLQTHNRFKRAKRIYSLRKVQNGIIKKYKKFITARRLLGKDRPKRRIFHSPHSSPIKEICKIPVGGRDTRIPLHDVRSGSSTQDLHETHENPDLVIEETENPSHNLHGRHAYHGEFAGGNNPGARHSSPSVRGIRIRDKLSEISTDSIEETGVPRNNSGQQSDVVIYPGEESFKPDKTLQKLFGDRKAIPEGGCQIAREIKIHGTSLFLGSLTNQTPPTSSNLRHQEKQIIRTQSDSVRGRFVGTKMVDKQPGTSEWESNIYSPTRHLDFDGCSERSKGGLGSRMPRFPYWGALEKRREGPTYQHTGAHGSRNGFTYIPERKEEHISPSTDRQHNSSELPKENGRNYVHRNDKFIQENLVVSSSQEYIVDTRVHPIETQHHSGLGVQKLGGFQRMAVRSSSFQQNLYSMGDTGYRPICVTSVPSIGKVHELETRSQERSNRCTHSKLEEPISICLPSIQYDRKSSQEDQETPNIHDHNNASVDDSALVSTATGDVNQITIITPKSSESSDEPKEGDPPPSREPNSETGSLVSIGESGKPTNISTTATSLIVNARASGTRKNYQSAWGKFCSWCGERKVDPISCSLKFILDYLGALYDNNKEYSCMNTHRSAISAYHMPIEGQSVGKHPLVCSLMKGASNLRPPQPRYKHVWDVNLVIEKLKSMPDDFGLTLEQLSYKTITLLSLCAIKRSGELSMLNVKWMALYNDRIECSFGIKGKTTKPGKVAKAITFHEFASNRRICPVTCLKSYLERTKQSRTEHNTQLVFLSVKKPHKPVSRSTLTKWVLKMLDASGIDTNKFKAHSIRAASSSKVSNLGLQLRDILEMGNWSNNSTWETFYHKRVVSSSHRFQEALLGQETPMALKKAVPHVD